MGLCKGFIELFSLYTNLTETGEDVLTKLLDRENDTFCRTKIAGVKFFARIVKICKFLQAKTTALFFWFIVAEQLIFLKDSRKTILFSRLIKLIPY